MKVVLKKWKNEKERLCDYACTLLLKEKIKKNGKKEDERVKRTEWMLERNNK